VSVLCFCDHAAAGGRDGYGDLGLGDEVWASHAALDLHAAELARQIAERAGTRACLNPVSRLFADANRDPADPACIPEHVGSLPVPGNTALSPAERIARVQDVHEPYHARLAAALQGARAALSVHSFTPDWEGQSRAVAISFLIKHDPVTADHLMAACRARFPQLRIRPDDPYPGWLYNYCVDRHLGSTGLPHALIEVRQDLLADRRFRGRLAETLAAAFAGIVDAR